MDYEKIEANWNLFQSLAGKLSNKNLDELLDNLGERLVMCPWSTKEEYGWCHPGGLIDHTLRVTKAMKAISEASGIDVDMSSIIKVGLLHELGKVGDTEQDYFVEQDSDWHREKLGQFYKYNEDLEKMTVAHRTLWLLQEAGITLSRDEWEAVSTSQGLHLEENRFYVHSASPLTKLLSAARTVVTPEVDQ